MRVAFQLDLSVIWKILSMISKYVVRNIFFSFQSLKTCNNIASNNLEMNFFLSWNVPDKKGLHFLHINVNSLLPKIEEVRFIRKKSKATVISITETKLDGTIFDTGLYIED